jgi:hypothetical protein
LRSFCNDPEDALTPASATTSNGNTINDGRINGRHTRPRSIRKLLREWNMVSRDLTRVSAVHRTSGGVHRKAREERPCCTVSSEQDGWQHGGDHE